MIEVWCVDTYIRFKFTKHLADKVTPASVFINGTRRAKSSDGVQYFEDFDRAKAYAVQVLRNQIERAELALRTATEHLKAVEATTADVMKLD